MADPAAVVRSTFDKRLALGIQLQKVPHNPQVDDLVQLHHNFQGKTLGLVVRLELVAKSHELDVGRFVFGMARAPEKFHALFLTLAMRVGIVLQKIYRVRIEFAILAGGIFDRQQLLQSLIVRRELVRRAGRLTAGKT